MRNIAFSLLFLSFSPIAFAQSYDEVVVIEGLCSFELRVKGTQDSIEKHENRFSGRGFLVGHEKHSSLENSEYVLTAGHVISCKPDPRRDFWGYDVLSFKRSELFVEYNGVKYEAIFLKEIFEPGDFGKEDKALITFLAPKNLKHEHFNLAPKNFKYKTGDRVYVFGFLYFNGVIESEKWRRVFQEGRILDIYKLYIASGFMAYPGMSGSPLIIEKRSKLHFWRKNKYVIGIMSRSSSAPSGERIPYSLATRVQKEF